MAGKFVGRAFKPIVRTKGIQKLKGKIPEDALKMANGTTGSVKHDNFLKLPDLDYKKATELRTIVAEQNSKALKWVKSDEWLNRRIKASGESLDEAKKAQRMARTNLNKIYLQDVIIKDAAGYKGSTAGFYWNTGDEYGNVGRIALGYHGDNKAFANSAFHEMLHAATLGSDKSNFFTKGIKSIPLEGSGDNFLKYVKSSGINKMEEQRVRGVKMLDFLEKNKQWKYGEPIGDEQVKFLKESTYYRSNPKLPNDDASLVVNATKDNLKDLLNTAYIGIGAVSGTSTVYGLHKTGQKVLSEINQ